MLTNPVGLATAMSSVKLKKPVAPTPPDVKDFRHRPDGDYVKAYQDHLSAQEKYEKELDVYEQTKLISKIKNSTDKYILKNYKIVKR